MDNPSRLAARACLGLAVLLLVALGVRAARPVAGQTTAEEAEAAVDGRLGGTFAGALERFGPATGFIDTFGNLYAVDGYGLFVIYAEGHVTEEHADAGARVNRFYVSAPRSLERPATEPDADDWTLAEATERVADLIPTDAELSDFATADPATPTDAGQSGQTDRAGPDGRVGQLVAECRSAALDELYAERGEVGCRVVLIAPTPETVSYAMLSLVAADEAFDADDPLAGAPPCAGVADWIRAAGDRLARAEAVVAEVGGVDETDPGAAGALRALAAELRDLATEQRRSNPPGVAERASFYLVSALTAYAEAIETAADGVEQDDAGLVDEAVATFEEAGRTVERAVGEFEEASAACALQLGTPVPTGSPDPADR